MGEAAPTAPTLTRALHYVPLVTDIFASHQIGYACYVLDKYQNNECIHEYRDLSPFEHLWQEDQIHHQH